MPDLFLPESAPVFRRVAAGTHPDLFTVEKRVNVKTEKLQSEIVIATVQEANAFMRLTPAEGGWRVVMIDGAEDMNPNAANALLKVLEEPPARAILLLISSAPGRCCRPSAAAAAALPLAHLPATDVEAFLADYAPELGSRNVPGWRGWRRGASARR